MDNSMTGQLSARASNPMPAIGIFNRDRAACHPRSNAGDGDVMQNDLLAALPDEELDFLLPHLELVPLPFDKELHEHGGKLTHIYFPTSAIVVLLYLLADGAMTEIGVTGHEGVVGISILMSDSALGTARVQSPGHAYRLRASILKQACGSDSRLQQLMLRYTHALIAQMAQNAVCGHHYSIDQQLSRWLLDRLDRLSSNEMNVTQETIANMLGVRRECVTKAAGKLQQEGLIQYRRGNITVLDREGLEMHAGECYQVARHEFESIRPRAIPNETNDEVFAA